MKWNSRNSISGSCREDGCCKKDQAIDHRKIRSGQPRTPALKLPIKRRPRLGNFFQQLSHGALHGAGMAGINSHPIRGGQAGRAENRLRESRARRLRQFSSRRLRPGLPSSGCCHRVRSGSAGNSGPPSGIPAPRPAACGREPAANWRPASRAACPWQRSAPASKPRCNRAARQALL